MPNDRHLRIKSDKAFDKLVESLGSAVQYVDVTFGHISVLGALGNWCKCCSKEFVYINKTSAQYVLERGRFKKD